MWQRHRAIHSFCLGTSNTTQLQWFASTHESFIETIENSISTSQLTWFASPLMNKTKDEHDEHEKVRSLPRDGTAWRRGESRKGVHRISRSGVPCFPQLAFSARSGFPAGGIIFGSQAPEAVRKLESGRAEFVHANPHTRTSLEAGSRGGG